MLSVSPDGASAPLLCQQHCCRQRRSHQPPSLPTGEAGGRAPGLETHRQPVHSPDGPGRPCTSGGFYHSGQQDRRVRTQAGEAPWYFPLLLHTGEGSPDTLARPSPRLASSFSKLRFQPRIQVPGVTLKRQLEEKRPLVYLGS